MMAASLVWMAARAFWVGVAVYILQTLIVAGATVLIDFVGIATRVMP